MGCGKLRIKLTRCDGNIVIEPETLTARPGSTIRFINKVGKTLRIRFTKDSPFQVIEFQLEADNYRKMEMKAKRSAKGCYNFDVFRWKDNQNEGRARTGAIDIEDGLISPDPEGPRIGPIDVEDG